MFVIDKNGIVGSEVISGSYNGDKFKLFIKQHLVPYFLIHRDSLVVMDNCKFHHSADVLRILNLNNIAYKFLHQYSPHLNPIEEFFGVLKAQYKAFRPRPNTREKINDVVNSILGSFNLSLTPFFERAKGFLQMALARRIFI